MENDRAANNLVIDSDVQSVLEFMQERIVAAKLIGVADVIPKMARLLWEGFPQEPCAVACLSLSKTVEQNPTLQVSIESSQAPVCERGDSVAGVASR